jgi:hypothetical protein
MQLIKMHENLLLEIRDSFPCQGTGKENLQNTIKMVFSIHKYKKYLIWPIKYIKHYKSTEYMKRTILSINMIGNEKQKTWQKNTIFKSKMLKVLCPC